MQSKLPLDNEPLSQPERTWSYQTLFHHSVHLSSAFGNDTFGRKAEAFARFFGTPMFLGAQTFLVILWIIGNASGFMHFDLYPFILLNLAFSVQAAYAAPLILLAQTRQADRDKAHADVDAQHREALAQDNIDRQELTRQNTERLFDLLNQNTQLTTLTKELVERVEKLTIELHEHALKSEASHSKA